MRGDIYDALPGAQEAIGKLLVACDQGGALIDKLLQTRNLVEIYFLLLFVWPPENKGAAELSRNRR